MFSIFWVFFALLLLTAIFFYFLPSYIAWNRKHYNFPALFILNLLLGWSFIGWVIALTWALMREKPKPMILN